MAEIDRLLASASYKGRPLFRPPPPAYETVLPGVAFEAGVDIGAAGTPGSHTVVGDDVTITARNGGTGGTADALHFLRNPVSGDFTVTARVDDFPQTNFFAKAGIMFRVDETPGSINVQASRIPVGHTRQQWRDTAGGPTAQQSPPLVPGDVPVWVRLGRSGTVFTTELSLDGVAFTTHRSGSFPTVPNDGFVGLFLSTGNSPATGTASFGQVLLEGAAAGPGPAADACRRAA